VEYLDLNVWVDQIAIMLMKYLWECNNSAVFEQGGTTVRRS
jgi:hypothetical protein